LQVFIDLLSFSLESVFPVFALFATGFVVGKVFSFDPTLLSRLVFWVFGTVLIFTYVNENPPQFQTIWKYFLGMAGVIFLLGLLFFLLSKWCKRDFRKWAFPSSFSNTGYLGYPVLEYAIGPHAIPLAVILSTLNTLLIPTYGFFIMDEKGRKQWAKPFLDFLKIPWIYGLLAGWFLSFWGVRWDRDFPMVFSSYLELLQQSAIPIILISVGVSLSRFKPPARVRAEAWGAAIFKLLVPPLFAVIMGLLLRMQGLVFQVFVLEVAMPSAVNTAVLAEGIGKEEGFISAVVVYSTFLFLVTFPIWYSVLF